MMAKSKLNRMCADFWITSVARTTIFYLPSGAKAMIVRAVVTPHEVFTFHHSISHPLCELEK